jgi:hypothetical protein
MLQLIQIYTVYVYYIYTLYPLYHVTNTCTFLHSNNDSLLLSLKQEQEPHIYLLGLLSQYQRFRQYLSPKRPQTSRFIYPKVIFIILWHVNPLLGNDCETDNGWY